MKPKKLDKRLSLNKRTISNLENKKLNEVLGGAPSIDTLCKTWGGNSCEGTICYSIDPPAMCPNTQYHTFCPEC